MTRDEIMHKIHALRTEDDYIVTKDLIALMDEAIADERDRCAKIAEGLISSDKDWDTSYWNQSCTTIANKIRR